MGQTGDAVEVEADRLVILMNDSVKMSRGKFAAQAVHAALLAVGAHPGVAVVVLGAKADQILDCEVQVRDAGQTEIEPGTLTAGAMWSDGPVVLS
jgi:PTH2 family peptidyl-tRNA hydrolase